MTTAFALAEKLKPRLANEFQRRLLAATVQSVQEASNPLRLNNFSASFRELFRHVLVECAPEGVGSENGKHRTVREGGVGVRP